MEKTQTNDYIIEINKNNNPCKGFKTKFSICMKNSDDNIVACQSLRYVYESCLREENKRSI